jgi:HD-GYP domain-containing protein (c-di-GMP phosphodiesterase class II)
MSNTNQAIATQLTTLNASTLADFFGLVGEAGTQIEQALLMLQLDSHDAQSLSELSAAIESVHNALADIGLKDMRTLTSSLLQLVHSMRMGQTLFTTQLGDVVLLAISDIKIALTKTLEGDDECVLFSRLPRVCKAITSISTAGSSNQDSTIQDLMLLLDPNTEVYEPAISASDSLNKLFSDSTPDDEELISYGVEENEDFVFFRSLGEPLETRAPYWRGRNQRMLRLALKMNDEAGRPVDPNQLAAAVYMHDVGMALLPLEVINHQGELKPEDLHLIREHSRVGFELLRYMKTWREAAQIVLQHHERMDGSGYPYGLKENDICEGAKIIAIVDAVDARTHDRLHAGTQQQALLRAAMEIGKNSDTQFSAKWVTIFKNVFQQKRQQSLEKN